MPARALLALAALLSPTLAFAQAPDILIADFESGAYGNWKTEGEAFGLAPAAGTLPNQQAVSGFLGRGLVNSYRNGDGARGKLTSPGFVVERPYLNFLLGGGDRLGEVGVNLLVGGKIVRTATGRDAERLEWVHWDVRELRGQEAVVQVFDGATGGWGHVNLDQILESEAARGRLAGEEDLKRMLEIDNTTPYGETYRPQFHFSAARNWLNDPNGLIFYKGEYHLFYQHDPDSMRGAGINMHWGHAVSPDLLHWKELPIALSPIGTHQRYSGSAVIDWQNSGGFQTGAEPAMVAFHTLTGVGQTLAYSNDRGRTWKDFEPHPVLADPDRDPKVFWHEPSRCWVMVLYNEGHFVFYNSPDLRHWTRQSSIGEVYECPDLFELPVDGDAQRTKWVLVNGDGNYRIGGFDGKSFTPESPVLRGDWGRSLYATQTWNDIPAADGRRIQLAWLRGEYPRMPFSQQMSFPCQLTLRSFPEGIRLCKTPAHEVETLHGRPLVFPDIALRPGKDRVELAKGDLLHIVAEMEPGTAETIGFELRGQRIWYSAKEKQFHAGGQPAPYTPLGRRIHIEILLDRTSVEVFVDGGRLAAASTFVQRPGEQENAVVGTGGEGKIRSLVVYPLKSVWG